MGILCFLDPQGAVNLQRIIVLKSKAENEIDESEVEREKGELTTTRRATALKLANELEQEVIRINFEQGKRKISSLIHKL